MSDITWTTHPRLPITEGIAVEGRSYTASELEIIAVQLNAGVTYQDEMASRCRDAWMALHPSTDLCITRDDGKGYEAITGDYKERLAQLDALEERLKTLPRGTWGLLGYELQHGDGRVFRSVEIRMSEGSGRVHRPQSPSPDDALPGYEYALDSMVQMDIYKARRAEEGRYSRSLSLAVIAKHGLRAGRQLRDVTINHVAYSTASIVDVSATGNLRLILTKRGSARRWECTCMAQFIACAELEDAPPTLDLLAAA